MRFSTALIVAAAPYLVSAAPASVRRAAPQDLVVLKFADVLEQLESTFYKQALAKFQDSDFTAAGFTTSQIPIQQFQQIGSDEATHSTVLQGAIQAAGGQPITGCSFDFSSVLTDVNTMAATARLVENVGVGAYLGAANLISDPVLLTAAASILTVEARHQTILNVLNGASAIPQAFDIALTPPQVLAIAGGFISNCDPGVPANAALAVTNSGSIQAGTQLSFKSTALNGSIPTNNLYCQMMVGGNPFSISLNYNECVVPPNINGPVAIYVTNNPQPLASNVVDQFAGNIIAGPTMAFIDSSSEMLGQMVRMSSSGGSSTGTASASSVTSTISPDDASSIIASASGTGSASSPSATGSSSSPINSSSGPPGNSTVDTSVNAAGSPGTLLFAGGRNTYTGPSPDGKVFVNGWSNVQDYPAPGSTSAPTSSTVSSSSSSATSSGSASSSASSSASASSASATSSASGP